MNLEVMYNAGDVYRPYRWSSHCRLKGIKAIDQYPPRQDGIGRLKKTHLSSGHTEGAQCA